MASHRLTILLVCLVSSVAMAIFCVLCPGIHTTPLGANGFGFPFPAVFETYSIDDLERMVRYYTIDWYAVCFDFSCFLLMSGLWYFPVKRYTCGIRYSLSCLLIFVLLIGANMMALFAGVARSASWRMIVFNSLGAVVIALWSMSVSVKAPMGSLITEVSWPLLLGIDITLIGLMILAK